MSSFWCLFLLSPSAISLLAKWPHFLELPLPGTQKPSAQFEHLEEGVGTKDMGHCWRDTSNRSFLGPQQIEEVSIQGAA